MTTTGKPMFTQSDIRQGKITARELRALGVRIRKVRKAVRR